jgi:signal transduction histidine kinase
VISSTHDIEALPSRLMELLVDLFKPDLASYYVKESFAPSYRKVASFPEEFCRNTHLQEKFEVRPNQVGRLGKAIDQKEIAFIENPTKAELRGENVPDNSEVASEIVVPILAQGTFDPEEKVVVAVIIFGRCVGNEFYREDFQLLHIIGSIISTAYNNFLTKSLKEKRVNFLASILNLQTVDLDVAFKNFLVAVTKLVPSKFIALWLYNELDDKLVIRSFHPSKIGQKEVTFESLDRLVLDCSKCLSGEVIQSKRSKVFTQVAESDKFGNPVFAKEHGIEWFTSIPILDIYKNPVGVLIISPYGKPEEFSENALNSLCNYISPIANTIRLASLLNEESLLFAFDYFFQNMLEFQDQQASWDSLAALISKQMKCAACSIFLIEADGKLHLKGSTGIEGNPPYGSVVYATDEGLTGKAFTSGKPLTYYLEDRKHYKGTHISKFRENIPQSKSIIMMPILDKNNCPIGLIRSNNKEEAPSRHVGRFTKEDIDHLQKISKIIANAHSRISWLKEKEQERERGMISLHHEILSPVDGIMQHIEWMKHSFSLWKSPTDWEKDLVLLKLEDMEQNSKLIDVVVTLLGRFDENVKLNKREVSLLHLINSCRGFMKNEAKRKHVDVFVNPIYVTKIRCDELQLMRVFYNLLRNAVKYSDPKERKKFIRILISENEPGSHFVLSFSDNGIGVLPGEEERIFQKYERGSNAAKFFPEGTGLGLAFCRSIMERHGGKIYVQKDSLSKPTVFHLRFPKWMRVN